MKKTGYFLRTILVMIMVFFFQMLASFIVLGAHGDLQMGSSSVAGLIPSLQKVSNDTSYLMQINIVYAIIALIVFGLWYHGRFVAPFKGRSRKYPGGLSLLTILTLIIAGFGLQFVGSLILHIANVISPSAVKAYNDMLTSMGYGSQVSVLLVIYTVILAPIVEEVIFRGLIYRFSRRAMSFWAANIWQALLFGILHMNLTQGLYAFVLGLFLGYIVHRGHGIKYSIITHITVNILGVFFNIFFTSITSMYPVRGYLAGIILLIFALAVFAYEFQPLHRNSRHASDSQPEENAEEAAYDDDPAEDIRSGRHSHTDSRRRRTSDTDRYEDNGYHSRRSSQSERDYSNDRYRR